MSEDLVIARDVELDLSAVELWALVADGGSWGEWLGAEADVEVSPGAAGTLVDEDGTERELRIDSVDPAEGIRFRWWPTAHPELGSRVELVVVGGDRPSVLRVREIFSPAPSTEPVFRASASAVTTSGVRAGWDRRVLALWLRAGMPVCVA